MNWYYAEAGVQHGPLSRSDLDERIAAKTIGRETLVWREGLADWRPIAEQPEFETLFAVLPALPSEVTGVRAVTGGDEPPSASDGFLESLGAETVTRLKAGPWSRFFARQIDMLLWSFPMGFGLGLGLLALPPKLYADIMSSNDAVLLVTTLFLAFIANAIVIAVFGNSVGKRLFGLKARPISPHDSNPGLRWHLAREMRVWFFGVAVGIPLFALFTASRNFYAVKRDGFARYDRSIAVVTARPIGTARRTFAILVFITLFGLNIALIALTKTGDLASHTQERWTNTATAQTVALPAGWSFVEVKPDGKAVTTFATTDGRYVLYFARESVNVLPNAPDGTPPLLTAYAFVITQTTSAYVTMRGDWVPATISGQDVLRREASLKGGPGTASYFIWKSAGSFWRTVVIDLDTSRPSADEAAAMVGSLARSTP